MASLLEALFIHTCTNLRLEVSPPHTHTLPLHGISNFMSSSRRAYPRQLVDRRYTVNLRVMVATAVYSEVRQPCGSIYIISKN